MIRPGGLLLVVATNLQSLFMGGVAKKKITKLGCEKSLCRVIY
jgi:hypothetical protein